MPNKRKPSKKKKKQKVNMQSADITADRLARLRNLLPEAFTEGKVDFDRLREALGEEVEDRPERYSFTWAGKRDAMRLLQVPSRATLVPCPQESVDWDATQNLFIEGENLEVLKLLYKSYAGRVKMIYIDPPYNTGNDFIYPDDFRDPLQTYLKLTAQKDTEGNLLTSNPETSGRYHSAWLSMMYPRLLIGRQLLREDGVIFISIDDHEMFNLRLLMHEIFGEENFIATIVWRKKISPDARQDIDPTHDYVVVYAKSAAVLAEQGTFGILPLSEERKKNFQNPDNDPRGLWASVDMTGMTGRATKDQFFRIALPSGRILSPPPGRSWGLAKATFERLRAEGRIWFGKNGDGVPRIKRYLSEATGQNCATWWSEEQSGTTESARKSFLSLIKEPDIFDFPKPMELISRLLSITNDPSAIVLDFFAGSATTADAVLRLNHQNGGNRKFIMVQFPEPTADESAARKVGYETIADIGKERIRRVIKKLDADKKGKLDLKDRGTPEEPGFRVFKLAESNYRPWKGVEKKDGQAYAETMEMFADPLLPGWKPVNVLYEVALKEGYSLTSKIEKVAGIKDNTVWCVTDPDKGQSFRICLDDKLKAATLKVLALKKDDLFICRDSALTDEQAANLALQCNLKTI
jgi:adenine-specific DNA-methyltransferase